ncbi:MAG: Zn-ribbon domain-containing OB-fold protein [Bacillota bacterium]
MMTGAAYHKPLPEPDSDSRYFWDQAREHRLVAQYCSSCQSFFFYPRSFCPECLSPETEWKEVSGRGAVYTYTVVRRSPSPAFQQDVPYVLAVVELAEGIRLMTNVVGCPPESVKVGMPVEVVFEDVTANISLPKFKPVL